MELDQFGTSNYIGDVDVDFNPPLNNTSGVYEYKLESKHGHFLAVDLDSVCLNPGCIVKKEVFEDENFKNTLIGAPLVSTNGSNTGYTPILKNVNTIWVRDTYSADSTGLLDNFANTYQTPGPLPILGAGAAFGFSRKLRRRIKASRNA